MTNLIKAPWRSQGVNLCNQDGSGYKGLRGPDSASNHYRDPDSVSNHYYMDPEPHWKKVWNSSLVLKGKRLQKSKFSCSARAQIIQDKMDKRDNELARHSKRLNFLLIQSAQPCIFCIPGYGFKKESDPVLSECWIRIENIS